MYENNGIEIGILLVFKLLTLSMFMSRRTMVETRKIGLSIPEPLYKRIAEKISTERMYLDLVDFVRGMLFKRYDDGWVYNEGEGGFVPAWSGPYFLPGSEFSSALGDGTLKEVVGEGNATQGVSFELGDWTTLVDGAISSDRCDIAYWKKERKDLTKPPYTFPVKMCESENENVRTTLTLPIGLYEPLEKEAKDKGCSLRNFILSYLDDLLSKETAVPV